MNKINLLVVIAVLIISCHSKEKLAQEPKQARSKERKLDYKQKSTTHIEESKHCYIKEIKEKNGKTYIVADYVDFLEGKKAFKKAKASGDLDYDISENGDTIFYLDDGYYISNVNPKLRTLALDKDVVIELLDYSTGRSTLQKVSIPELKNKLKSQPIMILKIENRIVIKMTQQYVP
jgi:hypothetical protein